MLPVRDRLLSLCYNIDMSGNKKLFLILFISLVLVSLAADFALARKLETTYPTVGNIPGPSSTRTLLPDYVKYIFNLMVALSGILVFGVIVYAGFRHATSAGNPTTMSDAKDRIISAITGMIIILSSYLILNTINPQLVIINPILGTNEGVIVYDTLANCGIGMGNPESQEGPNAPKPDINYIKFGVSSRTLDKLNGKAGAIWLYRSADDLKVNLYSAGDWGGTSAPVEGQPGACISSPMLSAQSVELAWQNPGVYLCKADGKTCSVYTNSQSKLADGFDNKVASIKFKNVGDVKYGAVLHKNSNYQGACDVFTAANPSSGLSDISSITVFSPSAAPQGAGVTLFDDIEYQGASTTPFTSDRPSLGNFNGKARSVQIDGNYMALLFRNENYKDECEVLRDNDPNLLIGNSVIDKSWGGNNTVSSLKVIPVKR